MASKLNLESMLEFSELSSLSGEVYVTEFTQHHANVFREQILKKSKMDPHKPIVININSYGGNADGLASMIGTLNELNNPIVTYCNGVAASAGAFLLSCGDYRFVSSSSRIMIHEVLGGAQGNVHDVVADAKEIDRLNNLWLDMLAKNCGLKGANCIKDMIKEHAGRDIWMNPDKALKFGIVDFIGSPVVNAEVSYSVGIAKDRERHDCAAEKAVVADILKKIDESKEPKKAKKAKKVK